MKNLTLTSFFALSFAALSSHAAESAYALLSPQANIGSSIAFAIPYSLGTHEGKADIATGALKLDEATGSVLESSIVVPISSIVTGNEKRDCHTREALGLDYAKANYPANHACNNDNAMPSTGDTAVAFPRLQFRFTRATEQAAGALVPGSSTTFKAIGQFAIHGVTRDIEVPVTLSVPRDQPELLQVKTEFDVQLPDYGIVVKKFLFVTVKETAHVALNLMFKKSN